MFRVGVSGWSSSAEVVNPVEYPAGLFGTFTPVITGDLAVGNLFRTGTTSLTARTRPTWPAAPPDTIEAAPPDAGQVTDPGPDKDQGDL